MPDPRIILEVLLQAASIVFVGGFLAVAIGIVVVALLYLPTQGLAFLAGRADGRASGSRVKWWAVRSFLLALVMVSAVGAYTRIIEADAGNSALLFVGLPALLAAGASLALDFRSPVRTVFGAITVFLVIALLWLGEGLICVIIAAPLFYLVGFGVMRIAREGYRRGRALRLPAAAMVLVLLTSLEGVHAGLSFPREQSVEVVATVDAPATAVRANLAGHPDLDRLPLAAVLRLGFPVPVEATGEGLSAGDVRRFGFRRPDGVVVAVAFRVVAGDERSVALEPVYDRTRIARWLGWRRTTIDWRPVDGARTEVRVTMHWERRLDPAWYFAPVQRFVVSRAARVLIAHAGQSAAPS